MQNNQLRYEAKETHPAHLCLVLALTHVLIIFDGILPQRPGQDQPHGGGSTAIHHLRDPHHLGPVHLSAKPEKIRHRHGVHSLHRLLQRLLALLGGDVNNFVMPDYFFQARPEKLQQLGMFLFSKLARDVKQLHISGYSFISFVI